jgi:hypothetical protein
VQAFLLANPGVRIRNSRHLPPLIIQAASCNKPGIFLLPQPVDAACSWVLYSNTPLGPALDYYVDFHRALRKHISQLFIVPFESATGRFSRVVAECNRRFGTQYTWREHDMAFIRQCFARLENSENSGAMVNELRVCRPSPVRQALKPQLVREIQNAPILKRKLDEANALYLEFRSTGGRQRSLLLNSSTAQVPTLG